ncbi:MAG: beta-ketoacyl-[acyl-carrier-protein] synthase family protein [Arcicella sp.]|nr:beta-ketoacyl-[acyl-carrier-protein] synthase family protein [Arcicella sp.]
MERVVITGIGISCSTGKNKEEFKESLYSGKVGLKPIAAERFPTESPVYKNKSACVLDQEYFEELKAVDNTILTEISVRVVEEAMIDAAINLDKINRRKVGICMATTIGGSYPFMDFTKRRVDGIFKKEDYELIFKASTPNITGSVLRYFGLNGPTSTISTACAAGTNSIGRAFDMISNGRIDMCVSGGVDVFSELSFAGFNSLQSLSRGICQPFDKKRDGLTLGDASAFVIMESLSHAQKRGAKIYCEIKGYSANNEAYHPTSPNPDGSTACLTMQQALKQADMNIAEIQYINAHGTATGANDGMEINGIRKLFGEQPVYLSSTKSMTGHTLGAAGSIELIATSLGMHHGFVPPSCNITTPLIEENDNLRIVQNKALDYEYEGALSNSFGFAGCMASMAIKRFDN